MKAVVQRVKKAAVYIADEKTAEIGAGMLVFLGVKQQDTEKEAEELADKIAKLRFFEDNEGKMNLSCLQVNGEALVVSQFTLYADCRSGRRPSYTESARPESAEPLYEYFIKNLRNCGITTQQGQFQKKMLIKLENDGPVTLIVTSRYENSHY